MKDRKRSALNINNSSKTELEQIIKADSMFLRKRNLIDYSLLLGIEPIERSSEQYYISIIDYLTKFNWRKKCELLY